jgi:predicted neutral ceramidase superfamily lipid hydrolase
MENSIIWLIKLLLAHLISDFWWQPSKWVKDKEQRKIRSKYLYLHILITGITALLFVGPAYWQVVLLITIIHGAIDLAKSYTKPSFLNFIIDQIAHLLVIIISWLIVFDKHQPGMQEVINFYQSSNFWIFAAAAFFLTLPSSIIIGQATKQWAVPAGLKNAGKYIGIIERVLICLLVYQGHYEAIGLLITGKSILRYNSSNEEVKTEYLLIGTLLSLFIAFAMGLALKAVV